MLMPIVVLVCGFLGLGLCAGAYWWTREKPPAVPPIHVNPLNKNVDLERYRPTEEPAVFVDKKLPAHPFRVGKHGVFCGVCLITTPFRWSESVMLVHTHLCTVFRKDWKILICKDDFNAEYYISEGQAYFRKH